MSLDLGRDVPDLEKLYAGKLWADFSYPKNMTFSSSKIASKLPSQNNLARLLLLFLKLRVVFPLRGPEKPPGRKSPKNGEKLQNSPPRSDPRRWGKLPPKRGKDYSENTISVIFL